MAVTNQASNAETDSLTGSGRALWVGRISGALEAGSDGAMPIVADAMRALPTDPAVLLLAALAELVADRPDRALVLLKRFGKRYASGRTSVLLTALALGQQNKPAQAIAMLDENGLASWTAIRGCFPCRGAMLEWLRQQLARMRPDQRPVPVRMRPDQRPVPVRADPVRPAPARNAAIARSASAMTQPVSVHLRRRKAERLVHLDWNPVARQLESPACEATGGTDRPRLVCDDALHLVSTAGLAPCPACGKPFCRACHRVGRCPKCGV